MSWLSSAIGHIPVVGGLINDVGKVGDAIGNGVIDAIPGGHIAREGVEAVGRMIPKPGGGAGSVAGSLLGGGGSGGADILSLLGVLNSASLQNKANSYANNALTSAQSAYDAKAPLRVAGINGLQFASTHGNPFASGFQAPGLPVAGGRPSPILPTADQPSTDIQDGSALPTLRAPSVGMASTPPNPGNAGTPPALRVATTPGGGTAPKGLKVANSLELQKLFA